MAKASQGKSLPARLLNLINPLRDPSFTVAIVLTFILVSGQNVAPVLVVAQFLVAWLAVKSAVWFFVNTLFSMGFIARKTWWVARHPRLAWRLLDALGTEEIIVGGLHPDMFATETGGLQEAQIGRVMPAMQRAFAPQRYPDRYTEAGQGGYGTAEIASYQAEIDRLSVQVNQMDQMIYDWITYTEEKWRAVSDSQLGWKPLRGRWNSWDEIYTDTYAARSNDRLARLAADAADAMRQRFDSARGRGSAASSVACFLRDLDTLRQSVTILSAPDDYQNGYTGTGYIPQGAPPSASRTGKSPIIRDPRRVVDAG